MWMIGWDPREDFMQQALITNISVNKVIKIIILVFRLTLPATGIGESIEIHNKIIGMMFLPIVNKIHTNKSRATRNKYFSHIKNSLNTPPI